jgi:hypothetical protein
MMMNDSLRKPYLDALQAGWGAYVERFGKFSPQEQTDFLKKQGYASLGLLLGHVVAWWEDGMPVVEARLRDPKSPLIEYDVDAFNARAVERFSQVDEATVLQLFEDRRKAWIKLVESLTDEAFSNKKMLNRLNVELIGHLEEHEIP